MAALCLHFQVHQSRRCLRKLSHPLTPLPTGSSTYTTLSGGTHTETHSRHRCRSLRCSVRMATPVYLARTRCVRQSANIVRQSTRVDHLLHICMQGAHQIRCRQPRPYPLLNVWPECRATDLQVTCVWLSFPRKHRSTALQQRKPSITLHAGSSSDGLWRRVRVSADPVFKAFRLNRGDLASLQGPHRS
jgi:hypothetical protein